MAESFRREAAAAGSAKGQSTAAHRRRRLGAGARRDIRWALRQDPGEHARALQLHGVRITYNLSRPGQVAQAALHQREEQGSSAPVAAKPMNSRQRRSRARAEKYYKAKAAAEGESLKPSAGLPTLQAEDVQAAAAPVAAAVTSFTFGDDLAASGTPSFVFGAATAAAPQDALMVDAPFSIGTRGGRADTARGRGGSK